MIRGAASRILRELTQSFEYSDAGDDVWDGAFSTDDFVADGLDARADADDDDGEQRDDDGRRSNGNDNGNGNGNDDDDDDDDGENALVQRLSKLSPDACTVCEEEISDPLGLFTLECGDAFCRECLEGWSRQQVTDVTRVVHKMAVVKPLAQGIEISYEQRGSLACPGLNCPCLLSETTLKLALTSASFERFKAVVQARMLMLRAVEAQLREQAQQQAEQAAQTRLPRAANGAAQCPRCEDFAVFPARRGRLRCASCLLPLCMKCEEVHPRSWTCDGGAQGGRISRQKAEKMFIEYVKKSDCRNCPRCKVVIEKNGGCPHMICKHCGLDFQWTNARLVQYRASGAVRRK